MRDRGALESALARPAATFGGEDLYPDIADKAAALIHSLALNHPFVDGNKRVAVAVAEVFLRANGLQLEATDDEIVELTLSVASGTTGKPEVTAFYMKRVHDR